jgi:hypothetical protein
MIAETTTSPNNKSISFSGKTEHEMPVVSQAQNRWAHANEDAAGSTGEAAREMVKETHGTKVKKLPQHVRKKAKRAMKQGLISEKAAKRHLGGY